MHERTRVLLGSSNGHSVYLQRGCTWPLGAWAMFWEASKCKHIKVTWQLPTTTPLTPGSVFRSTLALQPNPSGLCDGAATGERCFIQHNPRCDVNLCSISMVASDRWKRRFEAAAWPVLRQPKNFSWSRLLEPHRADAPGRGKENTHTHTEPWH